MELKIENGVLKSVLATYEDNELVIPDSVTKIDLELMDIEGNDDKAWHVRRVVMPDSVTEMKNVYCKLSGAEYIKFSDNLKVLGKEEVIAYEDLKDVVYPKKLEVIEDYNFHNSALEEAILPDGLRIIGKNCFAECEYLKKVYIPSTVVEIGEGSFTNTKFSEENIKEIHAIVEANKKGLKAPRYTVYADGTEEETSTNEEQTTQTTNLNATSGSVYAGEMDMPLKVVKTGGTVSPNGYSKTECNISIGAEILNPNKNKVALNVDVEIVFLDSSGRILDVKHRTINFIDANSTFYFGYEEWCLDNRISNFRVNANADYYSDRGGITMNFADVLKMSDLNYILGRDDEDDSFAGVVTNLFNVPLDDVSVYYHCVDSNGDIVGGNWVYVDELGANRNYTVHKSSTVNLKASKIKYSFEYNVRDLLRRL